MPLVWAARAALLALLAFGAMVLALAVTPRVSVAVFGQVVEVGAVPPSAGLGLSGPGQADLFGEGTVQTGADRVGDALAAGWTRYFLWLVAAAGVLGGALYLLSVGATALSGRDHRHRSRQRHLALLSASVAASLLVTLGFTALTVRTAVSQLGSITSLADLVGTAT